MRLLAALRPLLASVIILATASWPALAAEGGSTPSNSSTSGTNIVVGFVGGFVSHNNSRHGPVQLAKRIRPTIPQGTYVRIFENRHRKSAYSAILHLLDVNGDGVLSADEKSRAHIVLFGQSWGASAAVSLARDLRQVGVPVLLTVQVDSVAKIWQNDSVIPDNVSEAINFYQPHGLLHGRRRIQAADPVKTQILGNYLVDYRKNPVACPEEAPWIERVLTPSHMQSECDPQLWSHIEDLVRERLLPPDVSAQSFPAPADTRSSQR
jgi:hypothetical protein